MGHVNVQSTLECGEALHSCWAKFRPGTDNAPPPALRAGARGRGSPPMSPYHAGAAQAPPPVPGVHNAFHAGAPPGGRARSAPRPASAQHAELSGFTSSRAVQPLRPCPHPEKQGIFPAPLKPCCARAGGFSSSQGMLALQQQAAMMQAAASAAALDPFGAYATGSPPGMGAMGISPMQAQLNAVLDSAPSAQEHAPPKGSRGCGELSGTAALVSGLGP